MIHKKQILLLIATAVVSLGIGEVLGEYYPPINTFLISQANKRAATTTTKWGKEFQLVQIMSSIDGTLQHAYFSASHSAAAMPLLVSLHSWGMDYSENDSLAKMAYKQGWNYIHPDFRGPNWTKDACLSDKVIADIDGAIQYAIDNGPVDTKNIFIVGKSGGGYDTLGSYLKRELFTWQTTLIFSKIRNS
jgi:predicted alpha/beta-fold hydrolase